MALLYVIPETCLIMNGKSLTIVLHCDNFDNNYNKNDDYYDNVDNGCYLKSEKSVPSNASKAFLIQLEANF